MEDQHVALVGRVQQNKRRCVAFLTLASIAALALVAATVHGFSRRRGPLGYSADGGASVPLNEDLFRKVIYSDGTAYPGSVTGHLIHQAVESWVGGEKRDVLAVTFNGPIISDVANSSIVVTALGLPLPGGKAAYDNAATQDSESAQVKRIEMQPGGEEPNERRTILLWGDFIGEREQYIAYGDEDVMPRMVVYAPSTISITSLSILVDGEQIDFQDMSDDYQYDFDRFALPQLSQFSCTSTC